MNYYDANMFMGFLLEAIDLLCFLTLRFFGIRPRNFWGRIAKFAPLARWDHTIASLNKCPQGMVTGEVASDLIC